MFKFLENSGEFFTDNYFTDKFAGDIFEKSGYTPDHITATNKLVSPLSEQYFRYKNAYLHTRREEDKIKLTHDFHSKCLEILGYDATDIYKDIVYLNKNEVVPVRLKIFNNDKPFLYIMEMKSMIQIGEDEPDGIFDQVYKTTEWKQVFTFVENGVRIKPAAINEAISELFLLPADERPEYVLMFAGSQIFLIHYEKWSKGSYLLFKLEELFDEIRLHRDYLSLFYALLAKEHLAAFTDSLLGTLDEESHKAAFAVTKDLKDGIIHAVELLANEAVYYIKQNGLDDHHLSDDFAGEIKDESLKVVYRLLFLFYAESRGELDILPISNSVYQKGYSLEMLRDLEQVPLNSDSSRNGYFFNDSLWKLFELLHKGYNQGSDDQTIKSFTVKPLDTPLFDNSDIPHLCEVKFRNIVLQKIVQELSLSQERRGGSRGRISYSNLGINQLGSVSEGLLAYSGFFADEDYIEVKKADDLTGKDGTFLVPRRRRDEFKEDEILKKTDNPEDDVRIEKGKFVYRLNGRDRQKSASYYTPEVLTKTTVKYTLKHILEKVKNGEITADELLRLKILEPAMGAAAFQNEVINQVAEAYLEYKQIEIVNGGGQRIPPGEYRTELQKVKSYIAVNNVYGVDINPTAVELGKLSLWLNVIHKNMETPYFGHKLGVGNAVVGCWRKVYKKKDILVDVTNRNAGTKWWEKAPKELRWEDKRGKNEIYNFLLPDGNMAPVSKINFFKEEAEQEAMSLLSEQEKLLTGNELKKVLKSKSKIERINKWRTEFCKPFRSDEYNLMLALCVKVDELFEEHYRFQSSLIDATRDKLKIYGQKESEPTIPLSYDKKDELNRKRYSAGAPYFKLKLLMDYWCSLWFWDAADAMALPTREQYLNDLKNLLEVTDEEVNKYVTEQAKTSETNEFATKQAIQTSMFNESQQLSLGQQIRKREKSTVQKALVDLSYKNPDELFTNNNRLNIAKILSEKYKFFHYQLEFIEVFQERGGFDIVVGNPPWVKITFEEKDIFADKFPEIEIRSITANQAIQFKNAFLENKIQKKTYTDELCNAELTQIFLNSIQVNPLLDKQHANLYKCVLSQSLNVINTNGFIGILHPESIYDDPNGQILRKNLYQRLKYHFQFQNQYNLFEDVGHRFKYSVNIYSGNKGNVNFFNINNLFHPGTIDGCFNHSGVGGNDGMKIKTEDGYIWNTKPHFDRIINYQEFQLSILAKILENTNNWEEAPLALIHDKKILEILSTISSFSSITKDYEYKVNLCWDETGAIRDGFTQRITKYPDIEDYEMIYSGPHFFVANPLYKTPKSICVEKSHYDVIDITNESSDFLPRTNYIPAKDIISFVKPLKAFSEKDNWTDYYKLIFSRRLNQAAERTLQPSIVAKKTTHVNTVISIIFKDEKLLIELAGLTASIIYDFYIKTTGKSDLYDATIKNFPLGIEDNFIPQLFNRTLLLNCLNKYYAPLWEENFEDSFVNDGWSISDNRLKPYNTLTKEWTWNTPLRNLFERRQALVEIDVIVAMALGLSLDELVLIYNVQFPVLQQNEDDTWYDQKGNIVFTCSKGLTGVGLDRPQWNGIKDLKAGETYEHTIDPKKSELYGGKKIVYHAPFTKCDRVEDYRVAWEHFEKIFKNN